MRKVWIGACIILFVVIPLLIYTGRYQKPIRVASPGYATEISFRLDEDGTPRYSVLYGKTRVIDDSPLGLEFKQGGLLAQNLERTGFERRGGDGEYTLPAGKQRKARDRYNEMTVSLKEKVKPHRRIDVILRAYDDGVAFRYVIPRQKLFRPFEIVAEWSAFRFPDNHPCWAQRLDRWVSAFDRPYEAISIDDLRPESIVALPLVIRREDGITLAVTEADLAGWAGMSLGALGGSAHTLVSKLSPLADSGGICVRADSPHRTPWRVIMLGRAPGALIESSIVTNLARESEIGGADWVEPGLVLYPWWPDYRCDAPGVPNRMTFENQKYYVDFAAEKGIPYVEIGPSWYGPERAVVANPDSFDLAKPDPKLRLPELFGYARERGVGLLLWTHWRNVDRQIDSIFAVFERWGAAGVKIDGMNRDDQEMVEWQEAALRAAAERRLVVSFHGASKETGLQRTWPNLLTRDAVRGNEHNKWSEKVTSEHNVTIPFTRMLAGPMDYAPGGFDNARPEEFTADYSAPKVMTTRCQQLAMYVVYESPLQAVCDWPGAYRGRPEFEFIRSVPATWDETKALDGAIGDYVVVARRSDKDWYLGAMTDGTPRRLAVPLAFLGRDRYDATVYADSPGADADPKDVRVSQRRVTGADTLAIDMAADGGCAVRFERAK
jgi:alpha-glucosidase